MPALVDLRVTLQPAWSESQYCVLLLMTLCLGKYCTTLACKTRYLAIRFYLLEVLPRGVLHVPRCFLSGEKELWSIHRLLAVRMVMLRYILRSLGLSGGDAASGATLTPGVTTPLEFSAFKPICSIVILAWRGSASHYAIVIQAPSEDSA